MGATRKAWSVGENDPGYLPESDPAVLDTWEEAREAVREAATEWNNDIAEHSEECEAGKSADCDHCGNEGLVGAALSEAIPGESIGVRLDISGVNIRVFFAYPIQVEDKREPEPFDDECPHGLSMWLCDGPQHYPSHM